MYRQGPPPAPLADRFSSFSSWTQSGDSWSDVLSADPGFEIAWTFTEGLFTGSPCLTPASRRPGVVVSVGGPRQVRILRLRPESVGGLLGTDAADLVDGGSISLRDLGPRWRAAAGSRTERELVAALARVPAQEPDPLVRESVLRLRQARPVAFPTLAKEMGYSYAQWRRRMKAALGVSPKFLDRYLRLQGASKLAKARPTMSMAEVAFRTGYASDCGLAAESSALAGRTFRSLVDGFTLPE